MTKWKVVEKASAWFEQHSITVKKSVPTNSIGVEYLVHSVVFVSISQTHCKIRKYAESKRRRNTEPFCLYLCFPLFLLIHSVLQLTNHFLVTCFIHLSWDWTLSPSDVHSLLIWWFYSIPFFEFYMANSHS